MIARAVPFKEQKVGHVNRIAIDPSNLEPLNKDDIKTGPGLDSEQLDRLYVLLQNYRDCFATNISKIGCARGVEMKIDLPDNSLFVCVYIGKENWLLSLQLADSEISRIFKILKPENDQ